MDTEGYLLVHFNTNRALGNVPDLTSAAVVELVGHALVNGAINLDIDVIADVVGSQIGGQRNVTLLSEAPGEEIASPTSKSMSGRHVDRPTFPFC